MRGGEPRMFLPLHTLISPPDGVFLLPTSEQEILAQFPFYSSIIPSLDFGPRAQDKFPANVAPANENCLVNNGVIALVEAIDENSPVNDMVTVEAVDGDGSIDTSSMDSVEAASNDPPTIRLKPRLSLSGSHEVLMCQSLLPNRRPPSHRHAIPSGPWPWIDIDVPVPEYRKTEVQGWPGYPQALYQNWLPGQVGRAQIKQVIEAPWNEPCTIYSIGVNANGKFVRDDPEVYYPEDMEVLWMRLQNEVGC